MHCFKPLGERVMARDFDSQVAELQIRAAIISHVTAAGMPETKCDAEHVNILLRALGGFARPAPPAPLTLPP